MKATTSGAAKKSKVIDLLSVYVRAVSERKGRYPLFEDFFNEN